MEEVTDRFEYHEKMLALSRVPAPNDSLEILDFANYDYIVVPRQAGLYANIAKWGNVTDFPNGLIMYVDDNDHVLGTDAACSTDPAINQVSCDFRTAFRLVFPPGATKAYVNGSNLSLGVIKRSNIPPEIYRRPSSSCTLMPINEVFDGANVRPDNSRIERNTGYVSYRNNRNSADAFIHTISLSGDPVWVRVSGLKPGDEIGFGAGPYENVPLKYSRDGLYELKDYPSSFGIKLWGDTGDTSYVKCEFFKKIV